MFPVLQTIKAHLFKKNYRVNFEKNKANLIKTTLTLRNWMHVEENFWQRYMIAELKDSAQCLQRIKKEKVTKRLLDSLIKACHINKLI